MYMEKGRKTSEEVGKGVLVARSIAKKIKGIQIVEITVCNQEPFVSQLP